MKPKYQSHLLQYMNRIQLEEIRSVFRQTTQMGLILRYVQPSCKDLLHLFVQHDYTAINPLYITQHETICLHQFKSLRGTHKPAFLLNNLLPAYNHPETVSVLHAISSEAHMSYLHQPPILTPIASLPYTSFRENAWAKIGLLKHLRTSWRAEEASSTCRELFGEICDVQQNSRQTIGTGCEVFKTSYENSRSTMLVYCPISK